MFPKKGKSFPGSARTTRQGVDYVSVVAAELRRELGDTHRAVKTIMKWTRANERTVKNWLAGRYGPNGEHLILLFRHSDVVLDAFLRLAGREEAIAASELVTLRDALGKALMQINRLTGEGSSCLSSTKALVSLRIGRDVLEHFQKEGPGWQDRISEALGKVAGK